MTMKDILTSASPVIPVITPDSVDQALSLSLALYDGGLKNQEIALRSSCALDAIRAIKEQLPEDLIMGAGTVLTPFQLQLAEQAGADFLVSPGSTDSILEAARDCSAPFLPGVSNPTQAIAAFTAGFNCLKFFPAEASGGTEMLKALAGPLPEISFCPTGGINSENYQAYLLLPSVPCVAGTWLAPDELVQNADWNGISQLCKALLSLKSLPA
ncbi:keto-deoxy-phosphogluconate aldolase [Endozoicomonas sp. OPT23]|uniref:bifunctional 4-hydroxy-2-oxoglutarate aldolase/2-dehydro-3-deoxy-phosphogluconate aldolase n=1 Tax=Endozoicomonas sp. OPT23 TaxID=2072845 RepID=UPI00129B573E|nr:bifunctional 4-hydroxy-2-oxoglutarate aldolase/2-dehydro-3-deoxy-phosphogluconate aldolase [Endozoicomonas sp. OPT23]MRI31519.1 keto-deoxy-phosphogluconate aldolase [Endozoicomonas sp. OPT23]